jgi:peptidoglycan/xylan/chitin deacetylase (PgdA/CDA1 family)
MSFKLPFILFLVGALLFFAGCRQSLEPFNRAPTPGETAYFVPNDRKMVALTFDDGPNGEATERILDVLKERRVPATFFLVGKNAGCFPQIVKRISAEGHVIGNHTYRHSRFDQISFGEMEKDIADGSGAIETITGIKPRWFRPPYGINGAGLEAICRQQGFVIAGWSLDANDWNPHPVDELVDTIVSQATPGDIILLHDGWETNPDADRHLTVAAVPLIVDKLQKAGFVFVTLPELQRNAGAPLASQFGTRYFWDVPENFTGNLPSAFMHFMKAGSKYFFQDDHDLCRRGDVRDIVVRRTVRVPTNAPAGKYEINFGLFPPDKPEIKDRLKVRSDFPQAQRAVYPPAVLEIIPAQTK